MTLKMPLVLLRGHAYGDQLKQFLTECGARSVDPERIFSNGLPDRVVFSSPVLPLSQRQSADHQFPIPQVSQSRSQ